MESRTAVVLEADSLSQDLVAHRLKPFQALILSVWCGLVSGLLEVGAVIVRKRMLDFNHLYWMSRHFVWLIPLINLLIFLILGMVLSVLVCRWGRRGRWLAIRVLCAFTVLPVIWAVGNRIYGPAGFLVALGVAARLVPALERHSTGFRRLVRVSYPIFVCLVPILAACLWGADRLKAWREEARPLPPPGSPNVLLIVLDTVGADHLSLHGYDRRTSPTIDELATRGIRFNRVWATSSWTLPSHASVFTGRWPHELSASWFTPLDGAFSTLAEFLGLHGYATAGFIANSWYCSSDSGLDRGFTTYHDYIFPRFSFLNTAVLINRPLDGLQDLESFLEDWLDVDFLGPGVEYLTRVFKTNRKEATVLNREFLDWLSRRRHAERPFFAFLNFFDAHFPYEVPATGIHRFGAKPRDYRESMLIRGWVRLIQNRPSPYQIRFGLNCYDDCVADLDEQLGRLIDELDRRSILDRTWVIITSDHGESFGEKPGVFWHGTSLYETQLHVPLVIIPPAGGPAPRVVTETASLRDLPATIVDVLGFRTSSPFPGATLARFWNGSAPRSGHIAATEHVLSEVVPIGPYGPDPSRLPYKSRWPMAAVTEGDWTYIRREGNLAEELYCVPRDALEQHNFAGDPTMQSALERMRAALGQLTAGPLTPERFSP